jgi:hypothetical protein
MAIAIVMTASIRYPLPALCKNFLMLAIARLSPQCIVGPQCLQYVKVISVEGRQSEPRPSRRQPRLLRLHTGFNALFSSKIGVEAGEWLEQVMRHFGTVVPKSSPQ